MHIIAILLFPVRLVVSPLLVPLAMFVQALANSTDSQTYTYYFPLLGTMANCWLWW